MWLNNSYTYICTYVCLCVQSCLLVALIQLKGHSERSTFWLSLVSVNPFQQSFVHALVNISEGYVPYSQEQFEEFQFHFLKCESFLEAQQISTQSNTKAYVSG